MKFKNYLKAINQLAEDNPECLEFDVVYSTDDEGNCFELVTYNPCIGEYNEEECSFFSEEDNDDFTNNAVCVN